MAFGHDILTKRTISHDEAREAMQRLVNSHFNNDREKHEHARMSIPANPDRDDDLLLAAYIEQQRAKDQTHTEFKPLMTALNPQANAAG